MGEVAESLVHQDLKINTEKNTSKFFPENHVLYKTSYPVSPEQISAMQEIALILGVPTSEIVIEYKAPDKETSNFLFDVFTQHNLHNPTREFVGTMETETSTLGAVHQPEEKNEQKNTGNIHIEGGDDNIEIGDEFFVKRCLEKSMNKLLGSDQEHYVEERENFIPILIEKKIITGNEILVRMQEYKQANRIIDLTISKTKFIDYLRKKIPLV